ncbi:MAG: DUF1015 domain-containing protein [Oscillospiraceae bacterium]|nr:DUF1015 domain-containing protein [Oscillospiraceae bacterium]
MNKNIFTPADILLPDGASMEKWAVVACDQFSSEREYWERVKANVGDAPSTLNLIIPEAYLEEIDEEREIKKISKAMTDYLDRGALGKVGDCFVYVERTQPDGRVRKGIVGALDLEAYDFSRTDTAIRASEGTVLDRLPPRVRIRRAASLELPHIITFIDDCEDLVIGPLSAMAGKLPILYDFDLMEGGGHIKGMRVDGEAARGVIAAVRELHKKDDMLMVMGDGNHSLAAAKVYWDELKGSLSEAEREGHPARRALVELNNVYDEAIDFEAIHRAAFETRPDEFVDAFKKAMRQGDDYKITWVAGGRSGEIGVAADCIGDMLYAMQEFLDEFEGAGRCRVDYIHGESSVRRLSEGEGCVGLILPAMEKSELFATVAARGVFPKKSFSVGHARDKRYYLECRVI